MSLADGVLQRGAAGVTRTRTMTTFSGQLEDFEFHPRLLWTASLVHSRPWRLDWLLETVNRQSQSEEGQLASSHP